MDIKHEIILFDPSTWSLLVRYFSEEVPDGLTYNIDVPIVDGATFRRADIDALIETFKPTGQLERIVALKTAKISPALAAYIRPETVVAPAVDDTQPIVVGTDTPPIA